MKIQAKKENTLKRLSFLAFVLYFIVLIWGIALKCNMMDGLRNTYNLYCNMTLSERFHQFLIPFGVYFHPGYVKSAFVIDDVLNTVAFIPFGLGASYIARDKKLIKAVLSGFALSLTVEIFQLFSLIGTFTSSDIVCNVAGAFIGYCIYRALLKIKNDRFLTVCLAISVIALTPIAIYAVINTCLNWNEYLDLILRRI